MKDNKTKIGLLVAALMTMGQATQAEPSKADSAEEDFAPIESLSPEYRIMLSPQIDLLRKAIKIDWKTVDVGINRKGELILKGKQLGKIGEGANPTCWAE